MKNVSSEFTQEEVSLLAQFKKFHKDNETPNQRIDDKNPVEIAIAGAKSFPKISFRISKK